MTDVRTMVLGLSMLFLASAGCRRWVDSSSLSGTSVLTDWSALKEGHRFRISPSSQLTKCYVPGGGVSLQNCGDLAFWQIKKNINTQVKMVQSLLDYKCMFIRDYGAGTDTCNDADDSQKIMYTNGGLAMAVTSGSPGRPALQGVSLFMADLTPAGEDPLAKLIQVGKIENGSLSIQGGITTTEISWGYIPRIQSVAVASENGFIKGIQLRYANGTSIVMGDCAFDPKGNCVVDSAEHPDRPNPYVLDADETIVDMGVKFSTTGGSGNKASVRMSELVIETNKSSQKPPLWKGKGDNKAEWRKLIPPPNMIIAGLTIVNNVDYRSNFLVGIGVIMVDIDAYKAHNPDVFAVNDGSPSSSMVLKDGNQMIGLSFTSGRTFGGGMTTPKAALDADWQNLFRNSKFQFSSTFNASAMTGPINLSQVRVYFDSGMPTGIMVLPQQSQGNTQAETYGYIPEQARPQIFFEIKEGDYISKIYWRPGNYTGRNVAGPMITALKFELASGASYEYTTPSQEGVPWQVGLFKEGYAIVGFFGVATDASPGMFCFAARGVFELGAWFGRLSDLPGHQTPTSQDQTQNPQ